jgi:predicted component of type VI protein secretion system
MDQLRGGQFAQLHKLRTLNHYSSRLSHLVKAPSVPPFDMYLELRGLLGELAALRGPDQDLSLVSDYDHDAPSVPWAELISRIRMLLPREGEVTVFTVPFKRVDKLMLAQLEEPHIKKPNEYFLGVKTKQDAKSLSTLVQDPDRFKCMARTLARADIWGITLSEVKDPPLQLPKPPGLHYYRLLLNETPSSARMWERIQQEKAMTLVWRDLETADYDITLYMTVPETDDNR